ncbi:MAG TPA: GAF domain-containing sensor histidine kinase [Mycobacterium sp.]|uniref:GAF domain-containing sensor histidine kinase n=1 Tax=Mycolicibacterium sp. TaxID=2320850 RepID=UPI0025EE04FB|nr:GAF domain-containing sensor histidine kinase [Mycolicibacterium sp.]HPX35162.1 GAF domain-containing sensor histidine kinase [Mycobacterium sp.]HQC75576.1 GAF domain-containing sensor histidine kinase [Mycobacterium sp.]
MNPHAVHGLVSPDREVALLLDIIAATSSGPEVEPMAAAVAAMITAATNSDVCFVHVLDDTDRSLTLAGATPPFDEQVGKIRMPLGSGVSGWVASHREPVVIVSDKESDSRYVPIAALRGKDFTSMASVPMEAEPGGLVGVLNVHSISRREFSARDIELLLVIGRLIAGALQQARLLRRLSARERAHENFAEQVIAAQESERRRLAGDIHDGISQRLVGLTYRLDAAARAVDDGDQPSAAEQLEKARDLVDLTLGEARSAISGLRPPVLDDLGLAGGLASLAASTPEVDLELHLEERRLPEHIEVALYRIAQECVQNVVKHSRAMVATVTFAVRDRVARLEVSDKGVGFDAADAGVTAERPMGGYGMLSMAERADLVGGRFSVRSRPGEGTTVTVAIPLDD